MAGFEVATYGRFWGGHRGAVQPGSTTMTWTFSGFEAICVSGYLCRPMRNPIRGGAAGTDSGEVRNLDASQ